MLAAETETDVLARFVFGGWGHAIDRATLSSAQATLDFAVVNESEIDMHALRNPKVSWYTTSLFPQQIRGRRLD